MQLVKNNHKAIALGACLGMVAVIATVVIATNHVGTKTIPRPPIAPTATLKATTTAPLAHSSSALKLHSNLSVKIPNSLKGLSNWYEAGVAKLEDLCVSLSHHLVGWYDTVANSELAGRLFDWCGTGVTELAHLCVSLNHHLVGWYDTVVNSQLVGRLKEVSLKAIDVLAKPLAAKSGLSLIDSRIVVATSALGLVGTAPFAIIGTLVIGAFAIPPIVIITEAALIVGGLAIAVAGGAALVAGAILVVGAGLVIGAVGGAGIAIGAGLVVGGAFAAYKIFGKLNTTRQEVSRTVSKKVDALREDRANALLHKKWHKIHHLAQPDVHSDSSSDDGDY